VHIDVGKTTTITTVLIIAKMNYGTLRWLIVSDMSEVIRELEVGADRRLKKTTTTTNDGSDV